MINQLITALDAQFSLKNFVTLNYFLGVGDLYGNHTLHCSQQKYARDLVQRCDMHHNKSVNTLMIFRKQIIKYEGTSLANPFKYQSVLGAVQYLTLTQLEISFAINKF